MSNINCHRRKIIYPVRTLIIALRSWIIRRIHTPMPVFDDIEKNEQERDPLRATRLHFLNAIGSPESSSNARCHYGAEKFEAMVKLGVANSRMKDFSAGHFQQARVRRKDPQRSVRKTFLNRGAELPCERHAARPYARILRQHKQEKTVDGILRRSA